LKSIEFIQKLPFSQIISVTAALIAASLVFVAYKIDPVGAYTKIFLGAYGGTFQLSETITKTIPLLLCGVGLALAFRAQIWNIGAEGQLLIGATAASGFALFGPQLPPYLMLPIMFALAFAAGALWGLAGTLLKPKFQLYDAMATLLLNFVALKVLEYFVYGPWRGTEAYGYPLTNIFVESAHLPRLPDTRIHYPTLMIGLIAAVLIYYLLTSTRLGFEIRVSGGNPKAAKYAGINEWKVLILVMIISGGLAGMAGAGEVAGIQHRLRIGISPGYGYVAIIVAWLAKLNPLATIPSAIWMAGLLVASDIVQVSFGLPFAIVNVFNGLILLFLTMELTLRRFVKWAIR